MNQNTSTVKIRISGDGNEVIRALHAIGCVLNVAHDGRTYANRNGAGIRVYLDARTPEPTLFLF